MILLIFALWFNKGFDENEKELGEETKNTNDNKITGDKAESEKVENESNQDKASHNTGIKAALLELEKKFERCCD